MSRRARTAFLVFAICTPVPVPPVVRAGASRAPRRRSLPVRSGAAAPRRLFCAPARGRRAADAGARGLKPLDHQATLRLRRLGNAHLAEQCVTIALARDRPIGLLVSRRRDVAEGGVAVPAEMLPCHPNTRVLAIEGVQLFEVGEHDITDLIECWRRKRLAVRQKMLQLAKDPRPPLCGAADHQAIGTRLFEYRARFGAGADVAVRKNRNADRALDVADGAVLGLALIMVGARAPVDRERRDAGL